MMKYDCFGCKHAPYKKDYPCTTCGNYVLAEDGEGTVYVYTKWTPEENVFEKDKIPTFEYKDLNGRVLLMKVVDNEEGLIIGGTDVDTGITYVLLSEVK